MNKFLMLVCFWCFLVIEPSAQTPVDTSSFVFRDLVALRPSHIITVQQDWRGNNPPRHLYFQAIANGNKAIAEKLVNLQRGNFNSTVKGVFGWNGKLNLLTSLYHSGPGRNNFILQQFNADSLKEVHSQVIDIVATPLPTSSSSYLGYAISPDSSLIGFYSWIYAYSADSVRLNVQVFNRNLEKKWSRQYKVPFNNNRFFINECALQNTGTFFVFAENYQGKIGAASAINPNRIEQVVLQFEAKKDTARLIRPRLSKGTYLSSIKFGIASNEKLYGVGIWETPGFSVQSGLFTMTMAAGQDSMVQNLVPFPKKMYQDAERMAKQDTALGAYYTPIGFYGYHISKLWFQPDGQIYLLANQDNAYMMMRFNEKLDLEATCIIPAMRYGFFLKPYAANFFIRGDSAYCLQSQVEDPTFPYFKLIRMGVNGGLIHSYVNSRITTRAPRFILNTSYCIQIDQNNILLTATDRQGTDNLPRTLIFRVEKIEAVFKTN